jgi:hypothetical protein
MAFSFGYSQINIAEGFESVFPATWTNNGFAVTSGGACSGTKIMRKQFSQSSPFGGFSTSNYVSNGNAISFSVQYSVGQIGDAGTVGVETSYAVNNLGAVAITNGASAPTASCQTITFTIPASAVPAGSQVKFNFGGNRQSLSTYLNFDNIIINQIANPITPEQITNYPFNNSLNNATGSSPFSSPNTSFVNDRNSQASSAIRVGSTSVPLIATIANLPIGGAERSISFWHKKSTHTVPVGLFAYGTATSGRTFGLYFASNGNYVFQSSVNDVIFTNSSTGSGGDWVHSVLTFKNGFVKLYNNGTFINGNQNVNLNTENSTFRLGGNGAIVEFDDLKIYNYELTATEVGQLYTTNTLSAKDFSTKNLKVSLYPNPVKDVLNIETATEIKSVAIYNLLGQKVKTAKSRNIKVADLSNGTYMVRVEDVNNAVETMKIVKQ